MGWLLLKYELLPVQQTIVLSNDDLAETNVRAISSHRQHSDHLCTDGIPMGGGGQTPLWNTIQGYVINSPGYRRTGMCIGVSSIYVSVDRKVIKSRKQSYL